MPEGEMKLEEQAIACLTCGVGELITEDSSRLPDGQWPAWTPGPQSFPCPACNAEGMIWATEPREHLQELVADLDA